MWVRTYAVLAVFAGVMVYLLFCIGCRRDSSQSPRPDSAGAKPKKAYLPANMQQHGGLGIGRGDKANVVVSVPVETPCVIDTVIVLQIKS